MDTEIDEALIELLKFKNWDYIGIDVRIRKDKPTEFGVFSREEDLPEYTLPRYPYPYPYVPWTPWVPTNPWQPPVPQWNEPTFICTFTSNRS